MRLEEVTDKEWQLLPQYSKSLKYKKGFAFKVAKGEQDSSYMVLL